MAQGHTALGFPSRLQIEQLCAWESSSQQLNRICTSPKACEGGSIRETANSINLLLDVHHLRNRPWPWNQLKLQIYQPIYRTCKEQRNRLDDTLGIPLAKSRQWETLENKWLVLSTRWQEKKKAGGGGREGREEEKEEGEKKIYGYAETYSPVTMKKTSLDPNSNTLWNKTQNSERSEEMQNGNTSWIFDGIEEFLLIF